MKPQKTAILIITVLVLLVCGCSKPESKITITKPKTPAFQSANVPILMYHHIGDGDVSPKLFKAQMHALKNAGYNTVSFFDLRDYVYGVCDLPQNPIVITFDDGYLSNYQNAYPVLKECGFTATIFAIGISIGKQTYTDGAPMTPHFSNAQGDDMHGVINIQSHSYNMHAVEGRDGINVRRGVLRKDGESYHDYVLALENDCAQMQKALGFKPTVFSYPYGAHSDEAHAVLKSLGYFATVTTNSGSNKILKGFPESLYNLNRFNVTATTMAHQLLKTILK